MGPDIVMTYCFACPGILDKVTVHYGPKHCNVRESMWLVKWIAAGFEPGSYLLQWACSTIELATRYYRRNLSLLTYALLHVALYAHTLYTIFYSGVSLDSLLSSVLSHYCGLLDYTL